MTYGRHLEQRKFGVYYFRQTRKIGEKQKVKRFFLKKPKDIDVIDNLVWVRQKWWCCRSYPRPFTLLVCPVRANFCSVFATIPLIHILQEKH